MISRRAAAAAAVFAYESAALASGGRIPTITRLCGQQRWLAVAVIAGLVVHLFFPPRVVVVVVAPPPDTA